MDKLGVGKYKSWYVKNDGSQLFKDTVIKYLNSNYDKYYYGSVVTSAYGVDDNGKADTWENPNNFGDRAVELTLEQFIKLTTKEMTKELIGYKLKENFKQYEKAALEIVKNDEWNLGLAKKGYQQALPIDCDGVEMLKTAGVLDLWFEPIFKENILEVLSGTYFYCIKDVVMKPSGRIDYNAGKVYRSEQDGHITDNQDPIHSWGNTVNDFFRKATTEEIKAYLINLAKEKGFRTEVHFIAVRDTSKEDLKSNGKPNGSVWNRDLAKCGSTFIYDSTTDTLLTSGFGLYVVYEQGKWATIEPQEEIISVGGKFDVKIKDGKIWHDSSDITTFVKDLVGYFNQVKQFGQYSATIKDVTFSKTGCQAEITTLGDWLHVWDMYNKLQK